MMGEGRLDSVLAVARRHHQLGLHLAAGVQGSRHLENKVEGHQTVNRLDQAVVLDQQHQCEFEHQHLGCLGENRREEEAPPRQGIAV